mmetsp:Transcript_60375/g.95868  ORF Transcript_60375/g.95868 Transcript_60375/m.95868 type:complete len:213 (-) Transcript_60375:573-1211(-)
MRFLVISEHHPRLALPAPRLYIVLIALDHFVAFADTVDELVAFQVYHSQVVVHNEDLFCRLPLLLVVHLFVGFKVFQCFLVSLKGIVVLSEFKVLLCFLLEAMANIKQLLRLHFPSRHQVLIVVHMHSVIQRLIRLDVQLRHSPLTKCQCCIDLKLCNLVLVHRFDRFVKAFWKCRILIHHKVNVATTRKHVAWILFVLFKGLRRISDIADG